MTTISPGHRPARPGFTLIELLTVIAIIGILAAIIIPTVGKVRESARSSQCISNQRQIALAFGLYANDNKGFFPRAGQPQTWMLSIRDYIPARGNVVNNKVFLCPAAPQPPDDYTSSAFHYSASFAIEAGNSANAETGSDGNGPRLVTSIVNPSRTILLADGAVNETTFRANSSRTYNNLLEDFVRSGPEPVKDFTAVAFRHNSAMNVAYVDGHTARITWGDRYNAIPDIYTWNGKR